jgi:hypothetical protein
LFQEINSILSIKGPKLTKDSGLLAVGKLFIKT